MRLQRLVLVLVVGWLDLAFSQTGFCDEGSCAVEAILKNGCPSGENAETYLMWQTAFAYVVADDRGDVLEEVLFGSPNRASVPNGVIAYAGRHGGPNCSRMLLKHWSQIPVEIHSDVLHGAIVHNLEVLDKLVGFSTVEAQRFALLAVDSNGVKRSKAVIKYAEDRAELDDRNPASNWPSGIRIQLAAKTGSGAKAEELLERFSEKAGQGEMLVPVREVALCYLRLGDTRKAHAIVSKWVTNREDRYFVHSGIVKLILAEGESGLARQYCTSLSASPLGMVDLVDEWETQYGSMAMEALPRSRQVYLASKRLAHSDNPARAVAVSLIDELVEAEISVPAEAEDLLAAACMLLEIAYQSDLQSDIPRIHDFVMLHWEDGFSSEYFSTPAGRSEGNLFVLTDIGRICAAHSDFVRAAKYCELVAERIGVESPLFLPSIRAAALCGSERSLNGLDLRADPFARGYGAFCGGFAEGVRGECAVKRSILQEDQFAMTQRSLGFMFFKSGRPLPLPMELLSIR